LFESEQNGGARPETGTRIARIIPNPEFGCIGGTGVFVETIHAHSYLTSPAQFGIFTLNFELFASFMDGYFAQLAKNQSLVTFKWGEKW
jgi:hypothetical protein